ncbi:MAG TPA: bifunctional DNA-binding transcriptional regulator/O6-methylguanine-DNA methyltransferase Ada [Terriglobia bacterium]|nr:bifunctional DNA-binding transcriptional regulator/O6-methylguanine-DNA methyltransferase Ada [Terriglobia bacterium]
MMRKRRIPSTDVCWRAVASRDRSYDGVFVYAVHSTRVFCRPACPSRRPARRHVTFFDSPEAAVHNGFRPCLRCRPFAEGRDGASDQAAKWVLEACRYIEGHAEEPLNLAALAERFGVSRFQLQRTFKKATGVSPREYADACRMKSLKRELQAGRPVTDALYEAGFGSSSRLYERAPAQLGMTPADYRKGGSGMEINYAITRCGLGKPGSLGWMLVGATERGVCAVRMADSAEELKRGLEKEFPNAKLNGSHPQLSRWAGAIVRHLENGEPKLEVPIDVHATAFQRRVWRELTRIPYGETRSYREVARSMGKPRAVRAVGHACAANPVAVVVPCHRVVRADGKLGGYRWGLERKEALLKHEQDASGLPESRRRVYSIERHGESA